MGEVVLWWQIWQNLCGEVQEVLNNSSISVKHLLILHDKQKCHKTEVSFLFF